MPGATDLLQLLHSPGSSAIIAKQEGSFSLPAWTDIYIVALMPGEESMPLISAEVAAVVGTTAQNKYLSIGLSNC